MSFLTTYARHPRKLWLRRALFQVHLWMGVLLSLYVIVIGASGSLLVFEDEFREHALRGMQYDSAHLATPAKVMQNAARAYPGETVTYFMWPQAKTPVYTVYLRNANHEKRVVTANATTGELLPPSQRLFIDWVHELHVYLLMGQTGFTLNCVAGMSLLVLTLTGLILWWPGVRIWFRGLYVSLRHGWKRINYDAHNAVGIWTLLIVSMWAVTAIYFLRPVQTINAVDAVAPVRNMRAPAAPKPTGKIVQAPVDTFITAAHTLSPHAFLSGLLFPTVRGGNVVAYMDSHAVGDFSHRDIYTFRADGTLLTTWHYGEGMTFGDRLIWLLNPLHFGTLWGLPVKVLWSALGISLPVLSVTGLLMYWNRFLSKRWTKLRRSAP